MVFNWQVYCHPPNFFNPKIKTKSSSNQINFLIHLADEVRNCAFQEIKQNMSSDKTPSG